MGEHFQKAFGGDNTVSKEQRKEGSVTIDKTPSENSKSNQKVGEYVDYEEID